MTPQEFTEHVTAELERARQNHTEPLHSGHEAFGVIYEELWEYFVLVMKNSYYGWEYKEELIQVAAMCLRALEDVHGI